MFHYVLATQGGSSGPRWKTTVISAFVHLVVVVAIAIPALYATDALPEPKQAMAFFVSAPPAPPPPPPPAPALPAVSKPQPRTVTRARPQPVAPSAPRAAAPLEAPDTIAPETGFEGTVWEATVAAGFEDGVPGGVPGGVIGGIDGGAPVPPPPPPAPRPALVRVGGEITPPRLIHRVEPEYPLIAQRALIEGLVILEATVDGAGRVDEVRVLRSHSVLDAAAVAAVQQWRYEPLMLNGTPQPFVLTVTVAFSLPTTR